MTPTGHWRYLILRIYWDGEETPSVECPVGDFFACGWGELRADLLAGGVREPGQRLQLLLGDAVPQALPHHAREPRRRATMTLYYQINYTLTDVPDGRGLLPRAVPPREPAALQGGLHDPRRRAGARATTSGTYLAWGVNNTGWWGEGEIKFYMDGDGEFPTICGTGTEDYFCGSYNFENKADEAVPGVHDALRRVCRRSSARTGSTSRSSASACTAGTSWTRSASSRTCGSRSRRSAGARDGRYLPLQDDIASVAYWYQAEPHAPFPALPPRDALELK